MAIHNFTNQAALKTTLQAKFLQLKTAMDARRVLWDRLNFAKKKRMVQKDIIMKFSWETYKYLRTFFEGVEDDS